MRKQNNLIRKINDGIKMYFFGEKGKRKVDLQKRQDKAREFYESLVNGLGNEIEWTKKWIEREYALLGENFTPEKISERAIGIYDFMRNPIQNQIKKYQKAKKLHRGYF